jgi:ribosomal protein S3
VVIDVRQGVPRFDLCGRPGVIIGKKGADIEKLRFQLAKITGSDVKRTLSKSASRNRLEACAQGIADQLIRRVAFRRAMKRSVQSALRLGAEGIKITCSGRLGGAKSRVSSGTAKAAFRCTRASTMPKPRR